MKEKILNEDELDDIVGGILKKTYYRCANCGMNFGEERPEICICGCKEVIVTYH
ncbi:MAG: hypothetical protein LBL98_05490 [Ruminococcus sp.]|jgi:hypothetical protein|nr:hypothetical protein [Ruminococcus sp.]